jgi:hypothetical protein
LWKIAMTATVVLFTIALIESIRKPPGPPGLRPRNPLPPEFIGASLAAVGGFCLSGLASFIAVQAAWRHRIKLWLDSAVHVAREHQVWPPPYCGQNKANRVLLTALIPTLMLLASLTLLGVAGFLGWLFAGKHPDLVENVLMFGAIGLLFIGVPVAVLIVKDVLEVRIVADTAAECWEARQPAGHPPLAAR